MFDKVKMVSWKMATPIISSNYRQKFMSIIKDESPEVLQAFESSFCISGHSLQSLLPLPFATIPTTDFIRLQTFLVLDADKDYYTKRQNYSSYLLLYTYKGAGTLIYEGQTWKLHPGDGFLIDCTREHKYRTNGERWYHSDLHFYGGESAKIYSEFKKNSIVCFSCLQEKYQSHMEKVLLSYSLLSPHREYYLSVEIESLLKMLLLEQEKQKNDIPDTYRYLTRYIENNYQRPLSLDQLSSFSGISKYHLSREFKKYTGFSPLEYIIELRLTHAEILLHNTDIPAYKIGEIVGIPNEANFMRLFKKRYGTTPNQFRVY